MKENKKSVTELLSDRNSMLAKREQINIRMNEIDDTAQAAKRELSAEENVEYQKLQAEFAKLGREIAMNVDVVNYMNAKPNVQKSKNALLREAFQGAMGSKEKSFAVKREWVDGVAVADVTAGGMVPLTIKDILPPLDMGLIFD